MIEKPVESTAQIKIEAIKKAAEGFNTRDYDGLTHRDTLHLVTRSIVTADDPEVKIAGLKELGAYASRTAEETGLFGLQRPYVQKEAMEAIVSIAADEKNIALKNEALAQVAKRFNMRDYTGDFHAELVDAVRRIATSVVVEKGNESAASVVKKAIDILGDYTSRTVEKTELLGLQHPEAQQYAGKVMQLITSTMGVEKFADLEP